MTGSAAAKCIATGSQLEGYYRWDEPDSNLTVYLQPETVDRLQIEALAGAGFRSHTGQEVGGVLLGRTVLEGGRILIVVEEFEPVRCEHLHGPFYALRGEDAAVFEAAIAWGGTRPMRSVVGYYRSHNRNGLFLSADDLELIQCHFRGPESVFLLIKPLPNGACTGGFFFWKNSRIQSEFTDSEVPLIPISVSFAAGNLAHGEPADEIAPQPAPPAPEHRTGLLASPPAGARNFNTRLMGGLVLAGIALAATMAVIADRASRPRHQTHAPALPVAAARAVPASKLPAPPAPAAPQESKSKLRPPDNEPAASPRSEPQRITPLPIVKAAAVPQPVASQQAALPSPQTLLTPTDIPLSAAPQVPAAAPIVPPVPLMPPPFPQKPVIPPTIAPRDAVGSTPPNSPPPRVARTLAGPRVIHQVTPAVPRGVGPKITADVQVDVEVTIDAKGKVTAAHIVSTKGAAAELLTIEALKAAQLFRFQPAQENGRPVASVTVLTFRFASTAK
ncbi:MAG TPA: energy transducer TonB [Bryobacteraceae bacterium]|nr:energy transducer TonB [Bryobacteraceae bacterium]